MMELLIIRNFLSALMTENVKSSTTKVCCDYKIKDFQGIFQSYSISDFDIKVATLILIALHCMTMDITK